MGWHSGGKGKGNQAREMRVRTGFLDDGSCWGNIEMREDDGGAGVTERTRFREERREEDVRGTNFAFPGRFFGAFGSSRGSLESGRGSGEAG
jgi:hypothetical protein